MHRFAWLGALGLFACSSSGGDDDVDAAVDSNAGGGQTASGGGSEFEGAGGSGDSSGGVTGVGGAAGGMSTGGVGTGGLGSGGLGDGGAEMSSGGSSGGDIGTGGESSGVGGSETDDTCPYSGSVTYELNGPETWPTDVEERITDAMESATYYYNCYADLEKHITVNYNEGVPTAEANVDGWLSFGSDLAYMQTATAMHEIAHTLGVGFYPWSELITGGRWVGPAVDALMNSIPVDERDTDDYSLRTYITCDTQHFWPYGLNQASEYQSEWSVINHVRIVAAINEDKAAYLAP